MVKLSTEEKKKLLDLWKESGLSIKAFTNANETVEIDGREIKVPHHSTVYGWANKFGYSYKPGETPNAPENPKGSEEPDESPKPDETPEGGETGDDTESAEPEEPEEDETGDEQGDETEGEGEESGVLIADRVKELEPSKAPEPTRPKKEETPKSRGKTNQTLLIIGGAAVVLVGGFLLLKVIHKPRAAKTDGESKTLADMEVNPFDRGLRTLDEYGR